MFWIKAKHLTDEPGDKINVVSQNDVMLIIKCVSQTTYMYICPEVEWMTSCRGGIMIDLFETNAHPGTIYTYVLIC